MTIPNRSRSTPGVISMPEPRIIRTSDPPATPCAPCLLTIPPPPPPCYIPGGNKETAIGRGGESHAESSIPAFRSRGDLRRRHRSGGGRSGLGRDLRCGRRAVDRGPPAPERCVRRVRRADPPGRDPRDQALQRRDSSVERDAVSRGRGKDVQAQDRRLRQQVHRRGRDRGREPAGLRGRGEVRRRQRRFRPVHGRVGRRLRAQQDHFRLHRLEHQRDRRGQALYVPAQRDVEGVRHRVLAMGGGRREPAGHQDDGDGNERRRGRAGLRTPIHRGRGVFRSGRTSRSSSGQSAPRTSTRT